MYICEVLDGSKLSPKDLGTAEVVLGGGGTRGAIRAVPPPPKPTGKSTAVASGSKSKGKGKARAGSGGVSNSEKGGEQQKANGGHNTSSNKMSDQPVKAAGVATTAERNGIKNYQAAASVPVDNRGGGCAADSDNDSDIHMAEASSTTTITPIVSTSTSASATATTPGPTSCTTVDATSSSANVTTLIPPPSAHSNTTTTTPGDAPALPADAVAGDAANTVLTSAATTAIPPPSGRSESRRFEARNTLIPPTVVAARTATGPLPTVVLPGLAVGAGRPAAEADAAREVAVETNVSAPIPSSPRRGQPEGMDVDTATVEEARARQAELAAAAAGGTEPVEVEAQAGAVPLKAMGTLVTGAGATAAGPDGSATATDAMKVERVDDNSSSNASSTMSGDKKPVPTIEQETRSTPCVTSSPADAAAAPAEGVEPESWSGSRDPVKPETLETSRSISPPPPDVVASAGSAAGDFSASRDRDSAGAGKGAVREKDKGKVKEKDEGPGWWGDVLSESGAYQGMVFRVTEMDEPGKSMIDSDLGRLHDRILEGVDR